MAASLLLTDNPASSVSLTETESALSVDDAATAALTLTNNGLTLVLGDLP